MAEIFVTLKPILIAIAGGVIPSLVWLWFWLQEDRASPEPTGLIIISFLASMAVVYLVLPLQKLVMFSLPAAAPVVQVALLATIEEVAKYAAVFFIAFKSRYFDEPIDAVIYMVTAALGFAAMENILYVLKDLAHGGTLLAVLDGSSRFIGATILHTISSSIVGIAIAFAFYRGRFTKFFAVILSLAAASLLHAYFNLTIMETKGTLNVLLAFTPYWAAIIGIIIVLEFVKRFKQPTNNS